MNGDLSPREKVLKDSHKKDDRSSPRSDSSSHASTTSSSKHKEVRNYKVLNFLFRLIKLSDSVNITT